jgi:hypothetical protein
MKAEEKQERKSMDITTLLVNKEPLKVRETGLQGRSMTSSCRPPHDWLGTTRSRAPFVAGPAL